MKKFWAIFSTRNKEFLRDHGAMAWNFIFPVLVVFGFGFAFSGGSQDTFKVGLLKTGSAPVSAKLADPLTFQPEFLKTRYVQFVSYSESSPALEKLRRHQLDMVFEYGDSNRYWVNTSAPKGYLIEKILLGSAPTASSRFVRQSVEGQEIRYVDWLISGLLGMNMMFSALFGVGYTIVRYRKNGVLRRLKATPLLAFEFLAAQVFSRLLLIQFVTTAVFIGTNALLHFQMHGSYWNLFLVMSLGAMCLISLGLLVASRVRSEEFAGGLLNLISWPMMFLSGVWFSLEGAQPWVRKTASLFPLTHLIEAARAIMTEGAGFAQISSSLIILAGMTLLFLVVGSFGFKWE